MEIKYKNITGKCETYCPFGEKLKTPERMVHSIGCSRCKYFVSADTLKGIVTCSYDYSIKNEGIINKEDVLQIIKENLSINIQDRIEFGPVRIITVQLELNDEILSEESFEIND